MESIVKKPLRHVERGDSVALVEKAVEHELMLAGTLDRKLVGILERFLDIVGVERGHRADIADVVASQSEDIGVCFHHHSEVSEECGHTSEATVVAGDIELAFGIFLDTGIRQEVDEVLCHTYGTRAGTSAAMRRGEGLVQVDMHDVESHIAGTHLAEQRVEVGSVIVEETSGIVHKLGDLENLNLEHTERVGIGHHDSSHGIVEERLEILHVDRAVGLRLHLHHFEACHHRGRGVSAVCRVGNNDLGTPGVAPRDVILTHHHQTGKLSMGSGIGIERELLETRKRGQSLLQIVVEFKRALRGLCFLKRMDFGEFGHSGHLLVDFGVVLHGTASEGIETGVDTEVLVRKIGIVTHHVEFAYFGKFRSLAAHEAGGDVGQCVVSVIVGGELVALSAGT